MTKEYRGRTAKELSVLIVEGLWLSRECGGAGESKSDFHQQPASATQWKHTFTHTHTHKERERERKQSEW